MSETQQTRLLKKDLFGEVWLSGSGEDRSIVRDAAAAAIPVRWLARRLLRAEATVLGTLAGLEGVPELTGSGPQWLQRRYIGGRPMQDARPRDAAYFRAALRLLRRMHGRSVVHNDLAKEPNILVTDSGAPALIDFQLARRMPRRGRLFRMLAYEDLRHLLKHKRTYCPAALTPRQQHILAAPTPLARIVRRAVKPVYLLVTRGLLGWTDREGATDRGARG